MSAPALPYAKMLRLPLPSNWRPLIGVGAVLLGTFTAILNSRLTDIGLGDIRGALGVGVDEASWLSTSYVVAEVAAIPSAIWLRGILSPARGVMLGALIFTLLSLVAPFSPTLPVLLVIQALRGLSAGVLIPMAYAVMMRNLPKDRRLYGLSLYALTSSLTPSLSVYVEAWVIEHLTWQYLFWLNVLPGALTLFAAAHGLAGTPIKYMSFRRPDAFGLVSLSLALAALVAALDQGNRLDWLASGTIVGLLAAGLLFMTAFLLHSWFHKRPAVSPKLLLRRNIVLPLSVMFVSRIALMSSVMIVPQYLARVHGYKALENGPLFMTAALPQLLLTPLAAWLCYRIDPRNLLPVGGILTGFGLLLGSGLTSLWTADQMMPSLLFQSVGGPFLAIPIMAIITEDITLAEIPWIASLVHIFRTVGTAVGVAFVGTLIRVQEQVHSNLIGLHVRADDTSVLERLSASARNLASSGTEGTVAKATALLARTVQREAFVMAYTDGFIVLGLLIMLATLASVFMRPTKLPGKLL